VACTIGGWGEGASTSARKEGESLSLGNFPVLRGREVSVEEKKRL